MKKDFREIMGYTRPQGHTGLWPRCRRSYDDGIEAWAHSSQGSDGLYYYYYDVRKGSDQLWVPALSNYPPRDFELEMGRRADLGLPYPVRSIGWAVKAFRQGVRSSRSEEDR